ncbi:MAG: DsbA family protein [Acidimicrobiales bacterium]|nr:DsbA family protein [Acidimicrobiales bacterium]
MSENELGEQPDHVVVEVFADVCCPFTHVGLLRFVERRRVAGRDDVVLRVRAWPLELVNGKPLDAAFIDEEVDEIREQLAGDLFVGFRREAFPPTSLPAMGLAARAYAVGDRVGEAVSLELRRRLFEVGEDISLPGVLAEVAAAHGLPAPTAEADEAAVLADWEEGKARGVIGSPHFFPPGGDFFCPALSVKRVDGHLQITADPAGFDEFLHATFG